MTLLAISPDFASHYQPIAVVARAARDAGRRVAVATGPAMRPRVEADGFEWHELRLGAESNPGVVERSPAIDRFVDATRRGPIATLRLQARDRAEDVLWEPASVARRIADLCGRIDPDDVLVDQVSFGSTLAVYALGRPFVTLVPGHPSQLPVGTERYGVPAHWPEALTPDPGELARLEQLVDDVGRRFTDRWNGVLATLTAHAEPVDDAFRVHGERVIHNTAPALGPTEHPRSAEHCFLGPLVRDEALLGGVATWRRDADAPLVYVALGTFLSLRADVLERVTSALRRVGARAAIATGATDPRELGPVPSGWIVAPTLPQVALLADADLAIHHGGNNSVQESLLAGARQLVLPFSTDQFAIAADLERTGRGTVAAPNDATSEDLAELIEHVLGEPRPDPLPRCDTAELAAATRLGAVPVTTV